MSLPALRAAAVVALLLVGCSDSTTAPDTVPDDGAAATATEPSDTVTPTDDAATSETAGSSTARPDGWPADVPVPGPILEVDVPDAQGASLRFDAMVDSTDVAGLANDLAGMLEDSGWEVMVESAENQAQVVAEDGERRYEVRMMLAASGDQVLAELLLDPDA